MNNERNRRIITILSIFTIIFTVMGGSLAYWNWSSTTRTGVAFTIDKDFSCSADGGGNITPTNISLEPSTCDNTNTAIKRKIVVTPSIKRNGLNISLDLWLNINSIGGPLSNSENLKYVVTTNENSCTTDIVSSGNFKGLTANDKAHLLQNKTYTQTQTDTYYLYIWLDKEETDIATANQSFSFSLGGECTDKPNPEAPLLDENSMIPVTIDNYGKVTTISSDDQKWYNYDEKEWANVVLVSDTERRNYYLENLENNVEVTSTDIDEYYVWIPRYKYKISNNYFCKDLSNPTPETKPVCYSQRTVVDTNSFSELEGKKIFIKYMKDYWYGYVAGGSVPGIGECETGEYDPESGYPIYEPCQEDMTEEEKIEYWLNTYSLYPTSYDDLINNGYIVDEVMGAEIYIEDVFSGHLKQIYTFIPNKYVQDGPTSIDIAFEKQNATMSLGNASTTYRSHPAFWNDIDKDNNVDNNELLPGIWMAKFETSATKVADYTGCSQFEIDNMICGTTTYYGKMLPEESNIENLSIDINSFEGITWNNVGISTAKIERKIIKNSGWGASAYLSHSVYGINGEIKESEVIYGSGTVSYPQSTTGNITGIFHMEDGLYEDVDTTGIEIEATLNEYDMLEFAGFNCNGEICYGHTFDETYGWYGSTVHAPLFDLGEGPVFRSGVFSLYIDDPNWYNIRPPRMSLIPKM